MYKNRLLEIMNTSDKCLVYKKQNRFILASKPMEFEVDHEDYLFVGEITNVDEFLLAYNLAVFDVREEQHKRIDELYKFLEENRGQN